MQCVFMIHRSRGFCPIVGGKFRVKYVLILTYMIQVQDMMRQRPSKYNAATRPANWWAYRTPLVLKLLFSGQLPDTFFDDMAYGTKKSSAEDDEFNFDECKKNERIESRRDLPMWESRTEVKDTCKRLTLTLQDARLRQRQRHDDVSRRAVKGWHFG
jgi:hypothetical protein